MEENGPKERKKERNWMGAGKSLNENGNRCRRCDYNFDFLCLIVAPPSFWVRGRGLGCAAHSSASFAYFPPTP